MKTLLLMRHAKSSWDDDGLADHDRPLNTRGIKAAAAMAPLIASFKPEAIACSTAMRTRATLTPIIEAIEGEAAIALTRALYLSDEADYLSVIRGLPETSVTALVIGHNPVTESLTRKLASSVNGRALERIDRKFPTGAFAALSFPVERWHEVGANGARLLEIVRPRDLDD